MHEQRRSFELFEEHHGLLIPCKGIIDHVRLSLLHPLERRDRERLAAVGFAPERSNLRAKRGPRDRVYDPEPGAELLMRDSDGCRIHAWHDRITVTASLSRVLGLTNDRLDELTEKDVLQACSLITNRLFGWTTLRALFKNQAWAIVETALAIDVLGDARSFADAYEKTMWKPVNRLPRRFLRGLAWEGSDNRLTIYDKGAEMLRRGVPGGPHVGQVMPVERQWRGSRATSKLAGAIAHGSGPTAHFVESRDEGGTVALPRPVDHRKFHQVLAYELSLLDEPLPLGGSRVDAFAIHMAECERFHDIVRQVTDRKTYRSYRRKMLTARIESHVGRTLLLACYGQDAHPTARRTLPRTPCRQR